MKRAIILALGALMALPALAQRNFDEVQIRRQDLGQGVYVLFGAGGNIGVSTGADGAFLVDDQFAPLTAKITASVAEVTNQPIKFVLNTHYHGDHSGGNENLGKAGALIVAHENVRQRMTSDEFKQQYAQGGGQDLPKALPVVTYDGAVALHLNGQTIRGYHIPNAHTDGDTIIHFEEANVIHMGDTFFNGFYPFIHTQAGGNVEGIIAAADAAASLANSNTKIIPGHGEVTDLAALRTYRDMLVTIRDRVITLLNEDKSLEEIIAAKPSREWDETLGKGFIPPERLITAVYESLTQ